MTLGIVVMAKQPAPGRVKTRLAATMGDTAACAVYEALLWETLRRARRTGFAVRISLDGPVDSPFAAKLKARDFVIEQQRNGDLGERLKHALHAPTRLVALGADCVVFDPAWIRAAALAPEPAMVGPTDDGGYWAVGGNFHNRALAALLFDRMTWSVPTVFDATTARLQSAAIPMHQLPQCYDIDTEDDLQRLLIDPRCSPQLRHELMRISDPIAP